LVKCGAKKGAATGLLTGQSVQTSGVSASKLKRFSASTLRGLGSPLNPKAIAGEGFLQAEFLSSGISKKTTKNPQLISAELLEGVSQHVK